MMKLHEDLGRREMRVQNIVEYVIFKSFNIEFQNMNLRQALLFYECA